MLAVSDNVVEGGSRLTSHMVEEWPVEFRAYEDDAWYSVRASLQGQALRIRYENFDESHDSLFEAKDFRSFNKVEDFIRRFRPISLQLQDHECASVFVDMPVCASYSSTPDDVRFYDGVIEQVKHCNQSEEECSCEFIILWTHGPYAGNLSKLTIESICRIQQSKELNPPLSAFTQLVKERIKSSCSSRSSSKLSFPERLQQERRCCKHSDCEVKPSELGASVMCKGERITCHLKSTSQDEDVGGVSSQHILLLGNVDKGLSPLTIFEFLHQQTSVLPQVYISPSLPWEMYTRAAIVLDSEVKLRKLSGFLENPNHLIISTEGRPLVILEKLSMPDSMRESLVAMIPIYKQSNGGSGNQLMVVSSGTPKYMIAKRYKDLFSEFSTHLQRLHRTLFHEEAEILGS